MTPEAANMKAEDLKVGLTETFVHQVTEASVAAFARVMGDRDPLHLDREYATTNHGSRIAHSAY